MLKFIDDLMEKLQDLMKDTEKDAQDELEEAKNFVQQRIYDSISSGTPPAGAQWEELSGMTLDIRQQDGITSDKPLNATGSLLNSLTSEKIGDETYFVGWNDDENKYNAVSAMLGSGYSGSGGFEHEFDFNTSIIPVTKKMRWMLAMEYGIMFYKKSTIDIPQRPVIRPIVDEADSRFDNVEVSLCADF